MKTKLTLTVEDELIPRAKRYANAKGMSLSKVVETALRRMTAPSPRAPFGTRWRGKFTVKPREEARYRTLAGRYEL